MEAPKEHTDRPQGYVRVAHLSKSSFRINECFDLSALTADRVYAYDVLCLYTRSTKAGTNNLSQSSVLQQLGSEDKS